ncbi:MAG TPA: hypothetical protein PLX06_07315 [Fimbriimonadaceae bacterium]|nr:hypothetical protein [Fimbriimonadaceae bacterium]
MIVGTILAAWAGLQSGMPGFSGGPEDFLLTDKQAYLVLPPTVAGSGQTGMFEWSPTGRYLLLFRATPSLTPAAIRSALQGTPPPEPRLSISIWDKTNAQTRELGTLDRTSNFNSVTWIPNSDVAFGLVDVPIPATEPGKEGQSYRQDLLKIDLARGELKVVPLTRGGTMSFVQLHPSPGLGRIMALFTELPPPATAEGPRRLPRSEALTIDPEGRLSPIVAVPSGYVRRIGWVVDGKAARFEIMQPEAGGQPTIVHWAYDFARRSALPNAANLPFLDPPKPKELEIEVTIAPGQTAVGTVRRNFRSAWLRSLKPSEQGEYLLAPRADGAELSPAGDAVAILDQGVVTVRLLAAVSKELYLQAKSAAERAMIMSQAKQVATGLHIFAADADDRFPTQDEFNSGALSPYLKNDNLLKGFVYTYSGGSIGSVENPAGTMIGYVSGPGGFAVAYLDGHVKWLPELPKGA